MDPFIHPRPNSAKVSESTQMIQRGQNRPESSKVSESKEESESIRFTQVGGRMAPFQTLELSIDQKCGLAKAWLIIK